MAELSVFIEDVPEYQVRDGRMHIVIGSTGIVMPIDIFMQGCARGTAAVRAWYAERQTGQVIPMRA